MLGSLKDEDQLEPHLYDPYFIHAFITYQIVI